MRLEIGKFGGVAPRINESVLPDGFAAHANNFDPTSYLLAPFSDAKYHATAPTAKPFEIYPYNGQFLYFDSQTDICKAPIVNDPYDTVVWCEPTGVRISRNDLIFPLPYKSKPLGVPQLTNSITATAEATDNPPDLTDVDIYHQSYVVTAVNEWGHEGPASITSNTVTRFETASKIQKVTVTFNKLSDSNIVKYRIYRSATAGLESVYLYLGETTTGTFTDSTYTEQLGEPIESTTWFAPPDDNTAIWPQGALENICVGANSFLAGNTGNTICYSEANVPHAWPPEYQKSLPYKIVALAPVGTDILALTEGYPYLLSGTHPSVIAMMQITEPQSCISKKSVVSTQTAVFFASPDGLCVYQSGSVEVITREVLSAKQWQAMSPETLRGYYHDGVYYGKTSTHSFCILPSGDNRLLTYVDFPYQCAVTDLATDTLYVCEGDQVRTWNRGSSNLLLNYKTGRVRLPNYTNFSWASLRAESYPVTVTFSFHLRDSVKTYTRHINSDVPFILPSGYQYNELQVEFETKHSVINLVLAHSRTELNQ